MLWTQVLVCSVLNLFSRVCPSVVKVHGKEDSGEQGAEGPRCCQGAADRPEVCRLGFLHCLVLEVMVLHKIVILRGTRGCVHRSFPRGSLGKQGWPFLPTPWESSAFDSL